MATAMLLSEMTRERIREIAPTTTVIFPTTSIEQHGPHLPIRTDTEICEAVCHRAAEIAAAQVSVAIAPTLHFGSSHHHFPFPGVLSLSTRTFHKAVSEICEALVLSGFKRIMIINGHGGNDAMVSQVARDMVVRFDVAMAAASYWTIARKALVEEARVLEIGGLPGHAGGFETSCMMALRPDLVGPDTKPPRRDAKPAGSPTPQLNTMAVQYHNRLQKLDGYSDDARAASKELGERFLAIIARDVAAAIVQFSS